MFLMCSVKSLIAALIIDSVMFLEIYWYTVTPNTSTQERVHFGQIKLKNIHFDMKTLI